jgi:hypothetical protein
LALALSAALLTWDPKRPIDEAGNAYVIFKGVKRDEAGTPLMTNGTEDKPIPERVKGQGLPEGWTRAECQEKKALTTLTDGAICDLFEKGEQRAFNDFGNSAAKNPRYSGARTFAGLFAHWYANILGVKGRTATGESGPKVGTVESAAVDAWLAKQGPSFKESMKKVWRDETKPKGKRGEHPYKGDPSTVQALGETLARLTRKKALGWMLHMMHGPAKAAGLVDLQRFLSLGFDTFGLMAKHAGAAATFLETIGKREAFWINALFDDDARHVQQALARLLAGFAAPQPPGSSR